MYPCKPPLYTREMKRTCGGVGAVVKPIFLSSTGNEFDYADAFILLVRNICVVIFISRK